MKTKLLILCAFYSLVLAGSGAAPALKEVAGGFTTPVSLVPILDGSSRLLVVDQAGTITLLLSNGEKKPFLNLVPRMVKVGPAFDERGLLGLALHPRFNENHRLFVYYCAPLQPSAPKEWNHTVHLSEFKAAHDEVDLNSERVLLKIDEPYFNHNGGCLAFGPDGFLYVTVGDGGNANDQGMRSEKGNGQDTTTLLGSILRLDVDKGEPYGIPQDNPFAQSGGRPEIYAFGFRNPWRGSFDRGGEYGLLVGDIGQNLYEEVDMVVRGGNYGWNIREGFHCFDPKNPNTSPKSCPKTDAEGRPLLDPVFEYKNRTGYRNDPSAIGISVIGGYIYRGQALPQLRGRYIFGDWSGAWALPMGHLLVATPTPPDSGKPWQIQPLELAGKPDGSVDAYITGFGQDEAGELYVLTNGRNTLSGETGKVFKFVPAEK